MSVAALRYDARAASFPAGSAARALLQTMVRKRSNLCVSVDVTSAKDLLAVVEAVAPYVCLVKVRWKGTASSARKRHTHQRTLQRCRWQRTQPCYSRYASRTQSAASHSR